MNKINSHIIGCHIKKSPDNRGCTFERTQLALSKNCHFNNINFFVLEKSPDFSVYK